MNERAPARRRTRDSERGAVLLEFAFGSFILFVTMFGIINFGLAIYQYNMVSNLAQEGARWAAVHGSKANAPASTADVSSYVTTRAGGMAVTVTTTPAPSTITAGSTVTVQVSKSFSPFSAYFPWAALTLSSTSKMIMQR